MKLQELDEAWYNPLSWGKGAGRAADSTMDAERGAAGAARGADVSTWDRWMNRLGIGKKDEPVRIPPTISDVDIPMFRKGDPVPGMPGHYYTGELSSSGKPKTTTVAPSPAPAPDPAPAPSSSLAPAPSTDAPATTPGKAEAPPKKFTDNLPGGTNRRIERAKNAEERAAVVDIENAKAAAKRAQLDRKRQQAEIDAIGKNQEPLFGFKSGVVTGVGGAVAGKQVYDKFVTPAVPEKDKTDGGTTSTTTTTTGDTTSTTGDNTSNRQDTVIKPLDPLFSEPAKKDESINVLLKLSGQRKITERDSTSGIIKPRKIEMLKESASINVNADNGQELTNILGDIMRLAGVKEVNPEMFAQNEPMPIVKALHIMGREMPMGDSHEEQLTGDTCSTCGQSECGCDPMEENLIPIPAPAKAKSADDAKKFGAMAPAEPGKRDPFSTKPVEPEDEMEETYDNTPDDPTKPPKFDPDNMAHVINKVKTSELSTTPYGSGSNPMPMKENADDIDPIKAQLMQAYLQMKNS